MPSIFDPLTIRETTFKNRIGVSPMCMYSSVDGFANDWHLVHLGSRAVGGAGLIITEATAVVPEGRITTSDLGIWKDEHIEYLKKIVRFLEDQNCIPGIQLAHAGRKASTKVPWKGGGAITPKEGAWEPVAPVSEAFSENYLQPRELSVSEINKIIQSFEDAAIRALKAGFQLIEIHAAHGYLLHEFLSPLTNKRTDEYGGTFENRIRIVTETAEIVRSVWPSKYPLFVRLSATDWVEGGWTLDDSVNLTIELKKVGVDLIDCSSGGIIPNVKIPVEPMYQLPFAEQIKLRADVLTAAVGLIEHPEQASQIIDQNKADLVLIGREFLRNPYFPLYAAHQLKNHCNWPEQYERGKFRN